MSNDHTLDSLLARRTAALSAGVLSREPLTLLSLCQRQARQRGEQCAYRFFWDDGSDTSITFGQLDQRAREIASVLSSTVGSGHRALLIYPPGLQIIQAFFGCLYAGVLPVPATHPRPRRPLTRITAIAEDSQAAVALTTGETLDSLDMDRLPPALDELNWLATDELPPSTAADWTAPRVSPDDAAFLQYTSGSTSVPKGVTITHRNLLVNLEMIRVGFGIEATEANETTGVGVSWLPPYHDMGLIGGILESLYVGGCAVLMSPNSFIRRPERWLQLISDHRASVSGAPNFAYDLCVRNIAREKRAQFDLSSWRVAFCGAEPVCADTLRRFTEAFAPSGFREEALYPCYGMAETTLLASGGDWRRRPRIISVNRSRLLDANIAEPSNNGSDGKDVVSCGQTILDQTLKIVEPSSGTCCSPGHVGEIWIKGDNVSPGYWDKDVDGEATFDNVLNETGERSYLRTGDLGFILDDHLYVTGRLKDLLIFRGRNHYPHDIESTAQQVHPCLIPNSGAAFSVECDGGEELVLVQEVDRAYRGTDLDEVVRAIRRDIVGEHEVDALAVVLIRQASLPRTTSGKVQRSRCRELYQAGDLKILARWDRPTTTSPDAGGDATRAESRIWKTPPIATTREGARRERDLQHLAEQIETQLLQWLHERGGVPAEELDSDRPFAEYGVDSLAAVELSTELETWAGVQLSSVTAWEYPTPATLSRYLASEIAPPASQVSSEAEPSPAPNASEFEQLLAEIEGLSEEEAASVMRQERSADPREF